MDTVIGPCRLNPGSGGFGVSVWRQLHPPLLRLTESARFIAALEMDYWLQANRLWWETPDLLGDEAAIWRDLQALLPELAAFGHLERQEVNEETNVFRQGCRWAGLRTLAAAVGILAPTYEFLPALGGDAALEVSRQGLVCRLGKLTSWTLAATPAQSDVMLTFLTESPILSDLERLFFPFLADAPNLGKHFARWSAWAPLRAWQSVYRFPPLARGMGTKNESPGYLPRYTTEDIAGTGVPFATAALLASPLAADCLARLHEDKATAIEIPTRILLLDWALERERARGKRQLSAELTV